MTLHHDIKGMILNFGVYKSLAIEFSNKNRSWSAHIDMA